MKKVLAILLALVLTATLVACGNNTITVPTRGEWDEHVFTSEYLGLRFVLPFGWEVASEDEIAAAMGMVADMMTDAGGEFPDDIESAHDMVASNVSTGTNVQITFTRYGSSRRQPTIDQLVEAMTEDLESMGMDAHATIIPGTTRIGAYDWYSISTEVNMMGATALSRQFYSFHEGYVRIITIALMPNDPGTIEDVLAKFIGLDDPIPEPPVAQHAEELIGVWAWDMDDSYNYVFHDNGTGTRGFITSGFIGNMETFEWNTDGDHLVIGSGIVAESWTFTITNDVLTIESRQVDDLTFSYIRVAQNGSGVSGVIADYLATYASDIEAAMMELAGEGGRAEVVAGQGNEIIFKFFFGEELDGVSGDLASALEETLNSLSSFFVSAAEEMRVELDLDYMQITVQYYDQDENLIVSRGFHARVGG